MQAQFVLLSLRHTYFKLNKKIIALGFRKKNYLDATYIALWRKTVAIYLVTIKSDITFTVSGFLL